MNLDNRLGKRNYPYANKELSWLSFNERVLQEAEDPRNPLGERIKFMGIYSSNLDEFFRVRVAMMRRLCQMGKDGEAILKESPQHALKNIQEAVNKQRERFAQNYQTICEEMAKENIYLLDDHHLSKEQREFVQDYFDTEVRHKIFPIMVDLRYRLPELKDKTLYLAVEMQKTAKRALQKKYSIIEIPTKVIPRFIKLPSNKGEQNIILIDEIVRVGLHSIFRSKSIESTQAWNIKVVRDAELDIDDDDLNVSYINRVNQGLQKRKEGAPIWFLFDKTMPADLQEMFMKKLYFKQHETSTPGGRYHYFSDFIRLPELVGLPCSQGHTPIQHRHFPDNKHFFSAIKARDTLLYFPYHSFDTVIDLLREASMDPKVESIKVTLYRVAKFSSVVNALINAKKNRKDVLVILELQARFDEENNIFWANTLKENGIRVIFGVEGLKVHSKLLLINRKEKGRIVHYGGIGTGNLNEDTSRLYTDCFIMTADQEILEEVEGLFDFFENNYMRQRCSHLIISPFDLRKKLYRLIDNEIALARKGEKASIRLKLNNLSDEGVIQRLYTASQEGVKIKIIVRSRFSLVPGQEEFSKNIQAVSIVDQYLEHARFFIFRNGGDNLCFITSADWLGRNIDRRVEVTCPVYRKSIKKELKNIFDIQWADNQKARILDKDFKNQYKEEDPEAGKVRSQHAVYDYLVEQTAKG